MYGGTPWHWLAESPMGITRAALNAIPRVKAERALELAHAVGVGSGTVKNAAELEKRWHAIAYPQETEAVYDPRARRAAAKRAGLKVFSEK